MLFTKQEFDNLHQIMMDRECMKHPPWTGVRTYRIQTKVKQFLIEGGLLDPKGHYYTRLKINS